MKYTLYTLNDPRTNEIKYVGVTHQVHGLTFTFKAKYDENNSADAGRRRRGSF